MSETWIWLAWFFAVCISFAFIEGYFLRYPERGWTLSRTIATIGQRWPLSIALFGMFFGGLMVHFFWHFCL
jgi:hypothetical protein